MVIAVLIGIIIGFVAFAYTPIGNRYEVKSVGGGREVFYKYDKWTGRTYRTVRGDIKDGSRRAIYYEQIAEGPKRVRTLYFP